MKKRSSMLLCLFLALSILTACTFPTASPTIIAWPTPTPAGSTSIVLSNPDGDTWSVFIYLCGTDLESQSGYMASVNISEMLAAQGMGNVHVVFQTGGAISWGYDSIDAKMIQRFEVKDGGFILQDEQPLASMGDPGTLGRFLKWGVKNYPADKYMCLLWNHGGGSVTGVCFDEVYGYDSLDLDELALGLSMPGVQFEAVGFDACLMSSLETAAAIAPYSRYMIASEEIEPGTGWDYTAWLSYLRGNPRATGLELGISICDSYLKKCTIAGSDAMVTLSVIDLSLIPQLTASFDSMAAEMKGVAEDPDLLQPFTQAVTKAENYGGNNDNEGYTNMVDLGDLIRLAADILPGTADQILTALDSAVKYKVSGKNRLQSTGLSIFAPLQLHEGELDRYAKVAVSGHYLRYLEATVAWAPPEDLVIVVPVSGDQSVVTKTVRLADYAKVQALQETNFNVEFYTEVMFNQYYLTFTKGFDSVTSIKYNLYFMDEGSTELYFMGSDYDVNYDNNTMVVWSNFRNVWPVINGNTCSMIPISFDEDFILYTVPILLNGEKTNLRMTYSYADANYTIDGTWDGIEDSGMSTRNIRKLEDGDVIEFLFTYIDVNTEEVEEFQFGGFTVAGDIVVEEAPLFDSTFYYQFEITDIFSRTYTSDFVSIIVADGVPTIQPIT